MVITIVVYVVKHSFMNTIFYFIMKENIPIYRIL